MSVGVVIVTHYRLGDEFLQVLKLIVPGAPSFQTVSVDPSKPLDELRSEISASLREADEGDGVLVLTDMFGGTPSNVSLSFHDEHHVEVVTGMNLPMLIKLATPTDDLSLEDLAAYIRGYGQRNISVASELMPEKKGDG